MERSLRHLRDAVDELAGFLQALENGVHPSRAMLRQEGAVKSGSAADLTSVMDAMTLDGSKAKDDPRLPGAVFDIDSAIEQAGGDAGFLCSEVFPALLREGSACVAAMVGAAASTDLVGTRAQVNTRIHLNLPADQLEPNIAPT